MAFLSTLIMAYLSRFQYFIDNFPLIVYALFSPTEKYIPIPVLTARIGVMKLELNAIFKGLGAVLLLWVVLAIILEQVFHALFEWKVYKNYLDGKGLKFPIKVVVILILVNTYSEIDVFQKLLLVINGAAQASAISYSATALLLSGGSSTVFKVISRLREAKGKLGN